MLPICAWLWSIYGAWATCQWPPRPLPSKWDLSPQYLLTDRPTCCNFEQKTRDMSSCVRQQILRTASHSVDLRLLPSFHAAWCTVPGPLGKHSITSSQHFEQLRVSALTTALFRKMFPWLRLRAAQTYEYKGKHLDDSLTIVCNTEGSPLGPLTPYLWVWNMSTVTHSFSPRQCLIAACVYCTWSEFPPVEQYSNPIREWLVAPINSLDIIAPVGTFWRAGQSWRVQHPVPGKTTLGFSPAVPSGTVKAGRQGEFQKPNVLRKTLGHWEERGAMWRSCGRCISWWCQLCVSEVSTAPGEELKDNPMLEHLLPAKTISETQIPFAQNNSYTKFAYFGWHILFLY